MTDIPEDIPEDVWKAASAVVGPPDKLGYAKVFTDRIARALLAAEKRGEERERERTATSRHDYTDLYRSAKEIRSSATEYEAFDVLRKIKDDWVRAAGRDTVLSVESTVSEIMHRIRAVHLMRAPAAAATTHPAIREPKP